MVKWLIKYITLIFFSGDWPRPARTWSTVRPREVSTWSSSTTTSTWPEKRCEISCCRSLRKFKNSSNSRQMNEETQVWLPLSLLWPNPSCYLLYRKNNNFILKNPSSWKLIQITKNCQINFFDKFQSSLQSFLLTFSDFFGLNLHLFFFHHHPTLLRHFFWFQRT